MSNNCLCSLGSSFAAGPGIKHNYPHLLAEALGAELTDVTSSGSTLENIYAIPQSLGWIQKPLQIRALPSNSTLVTITSGGNDLGYSWGMLKDSMIARLGWIGTLLGFTYSKPMLNGEQLTDRFRTVIRLIKETAPEAKVLVVEYVNVFGNSTRANIDTPLSLERIKHHREQSRILAHSSATAAAEFENVEVIQMSDISRGHELGSTTPWVSGFKILEWFSGVAPLHPLQFAHQAIASAIVERLKVSPT